MAKVLKRLSQSAARRYFRLPLIPSKQLNQLFLPFTPMLPVLVIFGIVAAALEGLGIGLVIPLLGAMLGEDATGGRGGGASMFQQLSGWFPSEHRSVYLVAGMLVLIAAKNLVIYLNSLLTGWIYSRTSFSIRSVIANRLTRLDFDFFKRERPGRLLHVLSNDSWSAADAIQASISLIIAVAATSIIAIFLILLSWQMALGVAVGLAVLQGVQAILTTKLRSLSHELSSSNGALAARMLHLIHSYQLIRIFARERSESAAFDAISERVRRSNFLLEARQAILPPLMEFMQTALFLVVVLASWSSGVPFAVIAAFLVLLYRIQPQVRAVQGAVIALRAGAGPVAEVSWMLSHTEKPTTGAGCGFAQLKDAICFHGVTLRYAGSRDQAALDDVDLRIRAGGATAIVGRSGSGKSSIAALLCRIVEPTSGLVTVDCVPLSMIDLDAWRARLAVASPELELIDDTIEANIRYGRSDASDERVVEAARMADADAFIRSLPQGYATPVGYRGAELSAGQRQRIALARALVREPEILILDEATNALDALSEATIVRTLRARAGKGATIVISHQRATIQFCDDIIVLDHGRVAEMGAHDGSALGSMDIFYPDEPHRTAEA